MYKGEAFYKYFTSASTFFNSICDIMNYNTLLPLLDLFLSSQFISHYNSFDLLLIMLMIDLQLIMLMIDYCLFYSGSKVDLI